MSSYRINEIKLREKVRLKIYLFSFQQTYCRCILFEVDIDISCGGGNMKVKYCQSHLERALSLAAELGKPI